MAKKSAPKFPKTIYVKQEQENKDADPYLIADETTDSMEDGDRVAIYELREVKTKRVQHDLT